MLSCIGIYGVLAYLTGQRVPETGVRIALGASAGDVMWLVLRQSLEMIFVGVALSTAAALAAGRVFAAAGRGNAAWCGIRFRRHDSVAGCCSAVREFSAGAARQPR